MRWVQVTVGVLALLWLNAISVGTAAPVTPATKNPASDEIEKAEASFRKGAFDEAYTLLQAAVKKNPQLPPARLQLALLFLRANEGKAFRSLLEVAAAENPDHPDVYLNNGSIALAEGRITDTVLNCQTVLALTNSDRWTADQKKNFQREARAGLATAFEARKDWAAARTHLAAWLELDPKNPQVRLKLGRVLYFLGKSDDAFQELQAAFKDEPNLDPPEVSMGLLAAMKGEPKLADEWLQKAVQKHQTSVRAHLALASWLIDQSKLEAAKTHINQATKLDANSRDAAGLRGLVARQERDYPSAEKIFEELHKTAPGDFFAANNLALVLIESGTSAQQKRGVEMAEVNARQYSRNAEALATLGYVYFRTERIDDAEKALAPIAAGGQMSADTAYYMARVLMARSKWAEAKKILETALTTTGQFINRREAEKRLEEVKPKVPDEKKDDKKDEKK
jgi:tetratricopeptide (TPR) repeat protein